ncbi:MAG TPA: ABC transporter substrate-binding protein [Pilimelia sp.]|nr:ABC transporter substrate-binding protein [Pilimelia sp.]
MRRLKRIFASAIIATALVAAGCGSDDGKASEGSGSKDKVTYLTGFGTFGREAYGWVAKDKGFFAEAGLDVTVKPGSGTGDNLKQIASGQAQFAPVDFTGALLQFGGGKAKDFTAVAAIHQRTLTAIISLEGNNISSPKDLEGKTVADAPGSVVQMLFPTYAKLAGVDATKVKWVSAPPPQLPATLAAGTVQAIGQFVVGKPTIEAAAKPKKAVVLPYSDHLGDLYGNSLVTASKLAQDNPDLVKRFTTALLKGLQYAIDNPKEAAEILVKNQPTQKVEPATKELELMSAYVRSSGSGAAVGALDSQRVARCIALLQGAGAIPAGMTPEQVVNFDLVPKV